MNKLHINSRPEVVKRTLLFKTGDPLSVRLIEETERLLRANRYLYDVSIRPLAYRDGVADIEVRTRDTWSLKPDVSVSRAGGASTGRLSLEEENLLGSGISIGVAYKSDVDRSGTQFHISDNNAFGGRTAIAYSYTNQDDGKAQSFSLTRPFYELDARWAAGLSTSQTDTIDAIYNSGISISEYRHLAKSAEAFGGWSNGLIGGWTRRYSIGLMYQDDDYEIAPGRSPPERLPSDLTVGAPFLRFEIIEDRYRKDINLDQIGRTEDLAMGFQSSLRLGRALTALGSSRDLWVYSGSLANGFDVAKDGILLTSAHLSGRYAGRGEHQLLGGSARYFLRRDKRFVYYAAASGDIVRNPDIPGFLQLGGDNGLRGYPLRYQSGEQRALLTLEARAYSDLYPFRLIRLGAAVFYDVGRAWGGENQNTTNPGWLSDVGIGLRFLSDRSAFGNVLHADIAFPLNREPGIKSVQFILRTKFAL